MTSLDDSLRQRIMETTPEETPDGLMRVIYDGRKGVRLLVDPESGKAIASQGGESKTVIHSDPLVAARRALSYLLTGGATR